MYNIEKRPIFWSENLDLKSVTKVQRWWGLKYKNWIDEAYFYLTKISNKQNNRFWSQEQPLDSIGKPLNDKKIFSFFCDFCRQGLWNMLFFKQGKSTYKLRNGERLVLIETVFISKTTKNLFLTRWGPILYM